MTYLSVFLRAKLFFKRIGDGCINTLRAHYELSSEVCNLVKYKEPAMSIVQNNPIYNRPGIRSYAEVVSGKESPKIDLAINLLQNSECETSQLTAFFEDLNGSLKFEDETLSLVFLQKSQLLETTHRELALLNSKIEVEGTSDESVAQIEEIMNKFTSLQHELLVLVNNYPNAAEKTKNLYSEKIAGIKRPKQEIMNSLKALSNDFAEFKTELEEFKKLSNTVEYQPSEGISQALMQEKLDNFQAKLASTIKRFEKIEKEVEEVRNVRLGAVKLNSRTKGAANEKLLNDFTTLWCSIAAESFRLETDATFVSNKIAQLPLMNDLLQRMIVQTKKIQEYKYSENLIELRRGKFFISNTHVKEDKRDEFLAFVKDNKQAFENIFNETVECGKNVQEILARISPLSKQEKYAKALAHGNAEQTAVTVKTFEEISLKGNDANNELIKQYAQARIDLMNANASLNYEVSYIQAVAADPSMVYPYENTWSVVPNAEMNLTANLEKVPGPVVNPTPEIAAHTETVETAEAAITASADISSAEIVNTESVETKVEAASVEMQQEVEVKAEEPAVTTV